MAGSRTYIPAILVVCDYLKKYLNRHVTTLEKVGGKGFVAVLQLIVDLCIILAQIIDANHAPGDAWSDFTPEVALDSNYLTAIAAAIQKFYTTVGVTP